jgi:hypothetical protein
VGDACSREMSIMTSWNWAFRRPLFALVLNPVALFFFLFACHGTAVAETTGVALKISDLDSDWDFSGETRSAKSNSISLQIEERAANGLTVGASIGYQSFRLDGDSTTSSTKFDAENLEIFLRQEFSLSESTAIQGLVSYGYYTGRQTSDDDSADIDWSQVAAEIGVSFRVNNLEIMPFVGYINVDGDITGAEEGGGSFELEDPLIQGVNFDIYVEPTAFIRVRLQTGSQSGGYLSFERRY